MLKQRPSTRQPRTLTASWADGEFDASPASRNTFPSSRRYRSQPHSYHGVVGPEVKGDLHEESTRRETRRAEDARRIRLDKEHYRGSHIQSWYSDRNEQDHYDETDFSGRLSNVTDAFYNPGLERSKSSDSSSFSDEYPGTTDIRLKEIEREMLERERERERERRLHDTDQLARQNAQNALQEVVITEFAPWNKAEKDLERFAGAEYPKACVGKRMMKTSFLKEFLHDSSKDGEGLEGDTMGSGIQNRTVNLPADPSKLYIHPRLGKGSQINLPLILPRGNNYQPVRSMAALREFEDKFEYSTTTPSLRPPWADETQRRLSTKPMSVGP
ncbi:hypothetical protein F52700_6011 [Fusarium sp. NRRL 52700]|nr:hypothetical protein F52700_6011 [Fusarium sp. NRRL 52700]